MNTKKTMTYDVGNQGPGLGQAQKCDRVKLVNGIPILPNPHDKTSYLQYTYMSNFPKYYKILNFTY
jgi:hypothetical protein